MTKYCADCRDGDHDNYDDKVFITVVREPDTKKIVKRSYMCQDHRIAYRDDGYLVSVVNR